MRSNSIIYIPLEKNERTKEKKNIYKKKNFYMNKFMSMKKKKCDIKYKNVGEKYLVSKITQGCFYCDGIFFYKTIKVLIMFVFLVSFVNMSAREDDNKNKIFQKSYTKLYLNESYDKAHKDMYNQRMPDSVILTLSFQKNTDLTADRVQFDSEIIENELSASLNFFKPDIFTIFFILIKNYEAGNEEINLMCKDDLYQLLLKNENKEPFTCEPFHVYSKKLTRSEFRLFFSSCDLYFKHKDYYDSLTTNELKLINYKKKILIDLGFSLPNEKYSYQDVLSFYIFAKEKPSESELKFVVEKNSYFLHSGKITPNIPSITFLCEFPSDDILRKKTKLLENPYFKDLPLVFFNIHKKNWGVKIPSDKQQVFFPDPLCVEIKNSFLCSSYGNPPKQEWKYMKINAIRDFNFFDLRVHVDINKKTRNVAGVVSKFFEIGVCFIKNNKKILEILETIELSLEEYLHIFPINVAAEVIKNDNKSTEYKSTRDFTLKFFINDNLKNEKQEKFIHFKLDGVKSSDKNKILYSQQKTDNRIKQFFYDFFLETLTKNSSPNWEFLDVLINKLNIEQISKKTFTHNFVNLKKHDLNFKQVIDKVLSNFLQKNISEKIVMNDLKQENINLINYAKIIDIEISNLENKISVFDQKEKENTDLEYPSILKKHGIEQEIEKNVLAQIIGKDGKIYALVFQRLPLSHFPADDESIQKEFCDDLNKSFELFYSTYWSKIHKSIINVIIEKGIEILRLNMYLFNKLESTLDVKEIEERVRSIFEGNIYEYLFEIACNKYLNDDSICNSDEGTYKSAASKPKRARKTNLSRKIKTSTTKSANKICLVYFDDIKNIIRNTHEEFIKMVSVLIQEYVSNMQIRIYVLMIDKSSKLNAEDDSEKDIKLLKELISLHNE
ncbi:hypothetical protein EDEG_00344 [Edhazardia aedis USNM 41457]|uniref:Uncharacterized protein n=1 Tax=Edhazardia aedis (strain USNM 41457) TaxID=1003232 RepID=J9DGT5_EDHAE|nr:hypothetical protein EDEG_00344 [Edhazardia aedis USNM 41457]|eukprot:EJW01820.1 hypothetical protein EDEG_00344 [Edhazardia aedis USNM 41457]